MSALAWTNAANLRTLKNPQSIIRGCMNHENTPEWNIPLIRMPDRERLGQLIYEAVYASQGGKWEAVEPRYVWYEKADWLIEQLAKP